jgi:LPS export ABC transporter protein LptC
MKPLNKKYPRFMLARLLILFAFAFGMLNSCKNDIETINALTNEINLPDFSGYNIELSYTDSGILKGKIIAPEVNQYIRKEEPYYEFPKGMKATFYDISGNAESYIQANYAIYYDKKQLWDARNQVLAENPVTGEKLETEQMFWDQKEKRIYSDKFSKMTNRDGVFIGENGFEANENLSKKVMKGYSGKVNFRDDQPVDEQIP